MSFVSYVTQLWVLLLSLTLLIAVLAIGIAIRLAWKAREERPIEVDPEQRRRLEQRLLEISRPRTKPA